MTDQVDPGKWFELQKIIGLILISATVTLTLVWAFFPSTLTVDQREVLTLLLGGLISQSGAAVQYFFRKD